MSDETRPDVGLSDGEIAKLREVHGSYMSVSGGPFCDDCTYPDRELNVDVPYTWPCPVIRALDERDVLRTRLVVMSNALKAIRVQACYESTCIEQRVQGRNLWGWVESVATEALAASAGQE